MSDHHFPSGTEAYYLVRNMRSEIEGVNGRAYDFWGPETYAIMKEAALGAIEQTWANTDAAAFLRAHENTKEAMMRAVSADNDHEAIRNVPDLPARDNLPRPVAQAIADRVEAGVSAGAVRDIPKVEAYVESPGEMTGRRITQAHRDAARNQSSTSTSSTTTQTAQRQQQVERLVRAKL
jgi:hypothetical protein